MFGPESVQCATLPPHLGHESGWHCAVIAYSRRARSRSMPPSVAAIGVDLIVIVEFVALVVAHERWVMRSLGHALASRGLPAGAATAALPR
jgi:hypothetical protein